ARQAKARLYREPGGTEMSPPPVLGVLGYRTRYIEIEPGEYWGFWGRNPIGIFKCYLSIFFHFLDIQKAGTKPPKPKPLSVERGLMPPAHSSTLPPRYPGGHHQMDKKTRHKGYIVPVKALLNVI